MQLDPVDRRDLVLPSLHSDLDDGVCTAGIDRDAAQPAVGE
jgi:hypothetical protein